MRMVADLKHRADSVFSDSVQVSPVSKRGIFHFLLKTASYFYSWHEHCVSEAQW